MLYKSKNIFFKEKLDACYTKEKIFFSTITETNSLKTLTAVVKNTCKMSGVIRRLECLGRQLQWSVCMLHAIVLSFRKYMYVIDDWCVTVPSTSTGVVSMELIYDLKDLCIVNFKPIDGIIIYVSNEEMADLSTDQLYILKTCLSVQQSFTSSTHIPFLQTAMP